MFSCQGHLQVTSISNSCNLNCSAAFVNNTSMGTNIGALEKPSWRPGKVSHFGVFKMHQTSNSELCIKISIRTQDQREYSPLFHTKPRFRSNALVGRLVRRPDLHPKYFRSGTLPVLFLPDRWGSRYIISTAMADYNSRRPASGAFIIRPRATDGMIYWRSSEATRKRIGGTHTSASSVRCY